MFEDFDTLINQITKQIDELKERGIRSSAKYRLFQAFQKEEALYDDTNEMAAMFVQGFSGLPEDVTDKQLEQIAGSVVGLANAIYTAVLEDVGHDKTQANKVLKVMMAKPV